MMPFDPNNKTDLSDVYARLSKLESQLTAEREARQKAEEELMAMVCSREYWHNRAEALEARIKASQEQEPVSWRREWDGDISDLGTYVHADNEDELDVGYGTWQPLYTQPIIPPEVAELQRENVELTKLIEEAKRQAVPEWQPIDTAPKDKTRILVFSEKYGVREAKFYRETAEGTEWYDNMCGGGPLTWFYDVSCWMPLPASPTHKD